MMTTLDLVVEEESRRILLEEEGEGRRRSRRRRRIPFTIRLWNNLPIIITESPSLNIFRNRLTHLYRCLHRQ
jgi:hypothetical protein